MARGVLSGAIWGTVLSVGALGTLSVLDTSEAERREDLGEAIRALPEDTPAADAETTDPGNGADETAGVSAEADVSPTGEATDADPDTEAVETAAPETDSQVIETVEPEQPAVDQTAPEVDTAGVSTEPMTDQGGSSDPATAPAAEDGVTVASDAPELDAPTTEPDEAPADNTTAPTPEAGDDVAAMTAPDATEGQALDATPSAPDEETQTADAPALDAPESEVDLSVSTEPAQPPAPVSSQNEPAPAAEPDTQQAAETEVAATEAPQPASPAERPQVRQLVPSEPSEPSAQSDEDNASVDAAEVARPAIGTPATSLVERNSESSRLPTVGEPAEDTEAAEPARDPEDTRPPLQRYAAEVTVSDASLPRMSIVLIDDGTGPLGPDTLDNFPFPVTFAIDPTGAGAAERMRAYRALGFEVATLADLPEGAQPTDVEQILAGAVAAVPEAVALIEAPDSALQSNRSSTEQTTRFAADSGHGLVFLPNGLNTAEAIARRENVPTISVLRDFDGDGQDARTKRRFLDGAAFRARQDGNVVMLGRLTADTVSALLLWSLQDRASSVSMVPVSAILSDRVEN